MWFFDRTKKGLWLISTFVFFRFLLLSVLFVFFLCLFLLFLVLFLFFLLLAEDSLGLLVGDFDDARVGVAGTSNGLAEI